ncbi:malate dehydrogenase [Candidatus Photodesmus blepharus]|uniref:Malate dehydrogenase n=1 Tax=Candidatus Photodesmus blepharonis TaxID=1179155 RepID=A0A084CM23_9GAMM|nr:malate dehydrogenase [Candidatus Photodesmus blepharus]KEY90852.1 malate dehydrogenase [Candidatus Photodesmus blepharus]
MKIVLIGAAGGIGQALALLLKNYLPEGSCLALYDIAPITPGLAIDLSHIPTWVAVTGYTGKDITVALEGADIVLIAAGAARKVGMDRADLFNINADIIKYLAEKIAGACPEACIGVITNPINSIVPVMAGMLKKFCAYDKKRLFGITTLDVIRSEVFVSRLKNKDPNSINITVIGGHSAVTILPLLSQIQHVKLTDEEIEALTRRIQNAGTEVVEAKVCGGSATLSMGQAACRFCLALVKAIQGESNVIECAYVEGYSEYAPFFAQPVKLGKEGIETTLGYGNLSSYEAIALDSMLRALNDDISIGINFVNNHQ